jgi:hypothetical protein
MVLETINISILAFTWSFLLTTSGEIFDSFRWWIQSITLDVRINKMLYDCEKCVAGQMALWYVIIHDFWHWTAERFLIVPFSIFAAFILSKIIKILLKYGN